MALPQWPILIRCPHDEETFRTLTEFIAHCIKAHAELLAREADELCVRGLERERRTNYGALSETA